MELPEGVKVTPWLEQYMEWKNKYPDYLLLFRMGDFYEVFFDDAKTIAAALQLTLTSRDQARLIPMAGVPHHALEVYLARLMKQGYKVAVCEQMNEPDGKRIVERKVNRIVTPGTFVPEESCDTGRLAAFAIVNAKETAVALLSAETGVLEAGTFPTDEAVSLIAGFAPLELMYPQNTRRERIPKTLCEFRLSPQPSELFRVGASAKRLKEMWRISSLETYGCADDDPCVGCMNAIIDTMMVTHFGAVSHITRFWSLRASSSLWMDAATQSSLELTGSGATLYSVLDRCVTPMGKRTLKSWITRPLTDINELRRRHGYIDSLVSDVGALEQTRELLAPCRDVERAVVRLSEGGTPRDMIVVRDTLNALPTLVKSIARLPLLELFSELPAQDKLAEIRSLLNDAVADPTEGHVIRSEFDAELASLREAAEQSDKWLEAYLARERAACGLPKLRAGRSSIYGYYLELGKAAGSGQLPAHFIRRQTLVNAERFVTAELSEFEGRAARAESELGDLEKRLYARITGVIRENAAVLLAMGRAIGALDCVTSLSHVAWERNYVCPQLTDSPSNDIIVRGGRHPVLEACSGEPFVPNDIELRGDGKRVVILTGPNMAGKSTWLRMAALLCVMAQMGSWVPAVEASFGITDRIFTRIGARDDISRGNSTFMVEMLETANILHNVSDRSLVILDEVGRGTATWDGMSIAWAVLEYLHHGCVSRDADAADAVAPKVMAPKVIAPKVKAPKVLFATHYHELTGLESLPGVVNMSMAVSESENGIEFLHRVVPGAASRSYGVEVARLAGLPKSVLSRAGELLKRFEKNFGDAGAPRQLKLFDEC